MSTPEIPKLSGLDSQDDQVKKLNMSINYTGEMMATLDTMSGQLVIAQQTITSLQQAVTVLQNTAASTVTPAQVTAAKTGNSAAVNAITPATGILVLTDVASKFNALLAALQAIK